MRKSLGGFQFGRNAQIAARSSSSSIRQIGFHQCLTNAQKNQFTHSPVWESVVDGHRTGTGSTNYSQLSGLLKSQYQNKKNIWITCCILRRKVAASYTIASRNRSNNKNNNFPQKITQTVNKTKPKTKWVTAKRVEQLRETPSIVASAQAAGQSRIAKTVPTLTNKSSEELFALLRPKGATSRNQNSNWNRRRRRWEQPC